MKKICSRILALLLISTLLTGAVRGELSTGVPRRGVLPSASSSSTDITVSGDNIICTSTQGSVVSLHDVYTALVSRFAGAGGNSAGARITFDHVGNANYGHVYLYSSQGRLVENGYQGALSSVDAMVFVPDGEGDYVISYYISDSGGYYDAYVSGTITIRVKAVSKNISFHISDEQNYRFSDLNLDGNTAVRLLDTELGSYGSIRFGEVTTGASVGTLYRNSLQSRDNLVDSGTVVSSLDVADLFFVPSREGAFRIAYTAYSNGNASGSTLATGTLSIVIGADALNITVHLDSTDAYSFDSRTNRNVDSAAGMLISAINNAVGSLEWEYIRFDAVTVDSNRIGTLYESSSGYTAVSAYSSVKYQNIGKLYFVPMQNGTYEIGYSVYPASGSTSLANGTLRLVVPSERYGAGMDIAYSVSVNQSISLNEDDFIRWARKQNSASYSLSHVVFNTYERDFGTFYHSGVRFIPYNSADYYVSGGNNAGNTNSRYLNRISYTAPGQTGVQIVAFTCYGTTSTSSRNDMVDSGVMYIFVTDGEVPTVSFRLYSTSSFALYDAGFTSAYQSATGTSSRSPQFYIRLLDLPSRGTLYYDSTASGKNSVRLTETNLSDYIFYLNGTGRSNSIETLTYSPSGSSSTPDTVSYVAYSSSGSELFIGKISFQYGAEHSLTTDFNGFSFRVDDLYSASASDSVRYVTFRQPSEGKLYVNYSNGKGTIVTHTTRFFTGSYGDGDYPLGNLVYLPRAESAGPATLNYTVYLQSGASFEDMLRLNLSSRTSSELFVDVTPSDVGSWAANAIDFAAKWGLVRGTRLYPPYTFDPRNTMKRCDLVLILYHMSGDPFVSGTLGYPDVPLGAYYYSSALWASQNSLMEGVVQNGNYNPDGPITRQDFARILYNYTRYSGVSTVNSGSLIRYNDVSLVASYAVEAMTWAVANGYITSTSTSESLLSPTATATRAEIAMLLHRYLTF